MELFRPTAQLKISITPDCNNNCAICLNKTTRSRNDREKRLSMDVISSLIDEGAALGMIGVYWTGGEPLIEYKNLLKLMEYANKKGLLSTIVTNGGLIGAYGNYKKLNYQFLEKAGMNGLSTASIVKSLKESGLKRVYFSVDNCHTTLKSPLSEVNGIVPSEVVAKSIRRFLYEGFGKIHELDAIGYQLRVTATSSGMWDKPTNDVIIDVMGKAGLKLKKILSTCNSIYGDEKGIVFLKRLGISSIGDAQELDDSILENKRGSYLFNTRCTQFTPRDQAYDGGKYHGDLFVDYNGTVYSCGNHAYPIGNVFEESLSSIIKGVNTPNSDGDFAISRRVFYSLLLLSQNKKIGNNAIGEAFRLINIKNPEMIKKLKTQCGGCNCLGNNKELQKAFLEAFHINNL
ncbi:UNVERIFIED_CONTAM: MoaA/NifB/PqqE/SkfB family radical SAM enzyme [Acetivibrio alkalicellulosi]